MKYKAKKGAQFGDEKAQVYGEELERIQQKHGGILTPKIVVEEARKKTSQLHGFFEWNKDKAHEKFLLHQARMLINTIEVVVSFNGEEKAISRYINIAKESEDNEKTRVYTITEKVLSNVELRKQVLENAINEVDYWREKYKTYKELSQIFQAIKTTKKKIKSIFI